MRNVIDNILKYISELKLLISPIPLWKGKFQCGKMKQDFQKFLIILKLTPDIYLVACYNS